MSDRIQAAEMALAAAREATRRARRHRDQADELRVRHASLPGYRTGLELAQSQLLRAMDAESAAAAELAAALAENTPKETQR